MPIPESDAAGGLPWPGSIRVWRRRLGLIAVLVALVLAVLIGPTWCYTLISVAWSDPWVRFRVIQVAFVSYLVALIVVPIGFVGATAVGLLARRRKRRRLATWAGKAALLCLGLLVGIGLCEIACAWRLRSLESLAHPLDLAGVAEKPASGRLGNEDTARPITGMAGKKSSAGASGKTIDVAIIGGSSAKGFPFDAKMSLDRVIAWQLGRAFPDRTVRADNRAENGLTLEQAIGRLDGLERRPDLLIVYSGHNEFQSRFGWLRKAPYYRVESKASPLTFAQKVGTWTSTAEILGRTLDRFEVALAPVAKGEADPAELPQCTPEEYAAVLADYSRRLDGLISDCDAAGILTMIILPPSNDGAFDPNRSILPPDTSLAERRAFVARLEEIGRGAGSDPARAIAGYRRLIAEQPGFAETHFLLARLLESAGSFDEARQEYTRARDLDAFPIRCPTPFLDVCREVGRRHGSIVIDAPRLLALACPHEILNDRMFDDAHHPGVNGVVLMAREAIRRLKARGAFGWPVDVPAPTFTMADCIARFKLDQSDWLHVCSYSRGYYEIIRLGRRDTRWRDAAAARYKRGVELLERGTSPDEIGIPALRIHEELRAERPPEDGPTIVP